jgi:hypothetical protein
VHGWGRRASAAPNGHLLRRELQARATVQARESAAGTGGNSGASTSAFNSRSFCSLCLHLGVFGEDLLAQPLDLQARNAVTLPMEQIEDLWTYVREPKG